MPRACLTNIRVPPDAGTGAAGPVLQAALRQAAADFNAGINDLETFVMQLVDLTSRDAVVNSLHAVGYSTEVSINADMYWQRSCRPWVREALPSVRHEH